MADKPDTPTERDPVFSISPVAGMAIDQWGTPHKVLVVQAGEDLPPGWSWAPSDLSPAAA